MSGSPSGEVAASRSPSRPRHSAFPDSDTHPESANRCIGSIILAWATIRHSAAAPATQLPGGAALPPPRTGFSTRPGTARSAPATASLRTVRELARCLTRRRSRSRSRRFRPRSRGTTASRESRTRRWHRRCSSHRAGPGCPGVRPCCSMGAGRIPCPWRP